MNSSEQSAHHATQTKKEKTQDEIFKQYAIEDTELLIGEDFTRQNAPNPESNLLSVSGAQYKPRNFEPNEENLLENFDSKTSERQKQSNNYVVVVSECQQKCDFSAKNNDIYKKEKLQVKEEQQSEAKRQQSIQHSHHQEGFNQKDQQNTVKQLNIKSNFGDLPIQATDKQQIIDNLTRLFQEGNQIEIKQIFKKYVSYTFHPEPKNDMGKDLIINGRFVILFIQFMVQEQKSLKLKKYLQKYLLSYFQDRIEQNKLFFQEYIQSKQESYEMKTVAAQYGSENKVYSQIQQNVPEAQDSQLIKRTVKLNNDINTQLIQKIDQQIKRPKATLKRSNVKHQNNQKEKRVKKSSLQQKKGEYATSPPQKKNNRKHNILNSNESAKHLPSWKSQKRWLKQSHLKRENGSKYKYKVAVDKNQKVIIKQVRVSARLIQKQKSKQSKKKSNIDENQILNIDTLAQRLKEIKIIRTHCQNDFEPYSNNDREITKLLNRLQQLQNRQSSQFENQQFVDINQTKLPQAQQNEKDNSEKIETSRKQQIQNLKKELRKYKVQEKPLIIERIIDDDINGHGIYALIELGRISWLLLGSRFVIVPLTELKKAKKKLIDEDYSTAQDIVKKLNESEIHNIAFMQPTIKISQMLKLHSQKRN